MEKRSNLHVTGDGGASHVQKRLSIQLPGTKKVHLQGGF